MSADDLIELVPVDAQDPRVVAAIAELRALITTRFPDATFEVVSGEDPHGIYLRPTVDVLDLETVAEVFTSRLVDMQSDEGLPLYVFPAVTEERFQALMERERREPTLQNAARPAHSLTA